MNKKEMILLKANKMLAQVQDMMNDLHINENKKNIQITEFELNENSEEYKYKIDLDDIIVQPVDGVFIKNGEEEVRLLFFYIKPGMKGEDDETIIYKALAEFRIPRSTFQEIAEDIQNTASDFKKNFIKIDDSSYNKLPMFA